VHYNRLRKYVNYGKSIKLLDEVSVNKSIYKHMAVLYFRGIVGDELHRLAVVVMLLARDLLSEHVSRQNPLP